MAISTEYNVGDLDKPFYGLMPLRRGPDLLRTRTWSFDGGLLRAIKATTGEFRVSLGIDRHFETTLTKEMDENPSYHVDLIFQSSEQLLAASSSWGVNLEEDSATMRQLRRSLRILGNIDISTLNQPEHAFEILDEAKKEPAELILYREGLIQPDVLSVDGLFAAIGTFSPPHS